MNRIKLRHLFLFPNILSLVRIPLGILMITMWVWDYPKISIMVVGLLGVPTDYLDGKLARKWNQTSRTGELLDPLCDKFLLLSAAVVIISQVNYLIAIITISLEAIFILIPIIAVLTTEKSVASLWPGKVRINLQVLGVIFLYLGQINLGNLFLALAIPFALLTVAMGAMKARNRPSH